MKTGRTRGSRLSGKLAVVCVVGARPQFVKAAVLSDAFDRRFRTYLVHTGQHYDEELSGGFFSDLGLGRPDVDLGVGSDDHARQTSRMAAGVLREIRGVDPALVIVFGDTNSTLAGSLAAARAGVPSVHVEAGLRIRDRRLPEEVNRIAADHLGSLLLCPTPTAMENLAEEGLASRARFTGDVMLDAVLRWKGLAGRGGLARFGVQPGTYHVATVHRAENTDDPRRLRGILEGLARVEGRVVLPLHPRTRKALELARMRVPAGIVVGPALPYLELIGLLSEARSVLTDSGGLTREAYFLGVPCVVLRERTEWPETLVGGWCALAGADPERIAREAARDEPLDSSRDLARFGDGSAVERVGEEIDEFLRAAGG